MQDGAGAYGRGNIRDGLGKAESLGNEGIAEANVMGRTVSKRLRKSKEG